MARKHHSSCPTAGDVFGRLNWPHAEPKVANYRGLGLADMARAIKDERRHRANGELALHVLAVMAGILEAATEGRRVTIAQTCERPSPLDETQARELLAQAITAEPYGS